MSPWQTSFIAIYSCCGKCLTSIQDAIHGGAHLPYCVLIAFENLKEFHKKSRQKP